MPNIDTRSIHFVTNNGGSARGWLRGIVIALAAGAIIGAAAGGVYALLNNRNAAPSGPAAPIEMAERLTPDEARQCLTTAQTAGEVHRNMLAEAGALPPIHLPSRTAALTTSASVITCEAQIRPSRLCDAGERSAFVGKVRDFLGQADDLTGSINGALAEITGSSQVMMADLYIQTLGMTTGAVQLDRKSVEGTVKRLHADGIVVEADYGMMFGLGTPAQISALLKTTPAGASPCR